VTISNDGNLAAARTRLENAVSAAIDPKPEYDDGQVHWVDSRYSQVRAAVGSMRKGASSHAFASQAPGWVDAMDLLRDIDRETAKQESRRQLYPYHSSLNTELRLQLIEKRGWRPQDVATMDEISAWLEAWAKRVETLFDPPPIKHLASPCPACNTRWVYHPDSSGERNDDGTPRLVRQAALQITTAGCVCTKCHHTWAPEYFMFLAKVLGYQLPAGVLE
jgi:hypothetical protein